MTHQPRIRMFAGPNGSGKSTVKEYLLPQHIGAYLNADDLEQQLKRHHFLDLTTYHRSLKAEALLNFLRSKKRPKAGELIPLLALDPLIISTSSIQFVESEIDSYLCARIIDYIRLTFLELKTSFTFETVMSHISKVEFLQEAKRQGFRTYLYFVSTVDPAINISRVQYRVKMGGHDVPEEKIKQRYYRSMDLLMQAVEASDRTYIFDNSADGQLASFLAEIESAEELKMNPAVTRVPQWFAQRVLKEFET